MDYDQILPGLFVGSHPRCGDDIDKLKNESGITAVLNLQTDEDMVWWKLDWPALTLQYGTCSVECRRVPIRDFDTADLADKLPDAVSALAQLLQAGHTVYVHCNAGAWRSPTVAIAYLHWCEGWDLDKAVAHVEQHRPCSPGLEAIRRATQNLLRDETIRQKIQWRATGWGG
ncbi:MAG: dual specificity protein phosphatase family protein [Acidobacteria bacterium]|nr:dual specificity protein phosphatase family protein [Acidobacteriota bacterium]